MMNKIKSTMQLKKQKATEEKRKENYNKDPKLGS